MSRRIALVLVFVLLAGFAFAGGSEEGGSQDAASFNASGYPVVDEPYTLRVFKQINAEQTKPFNDISIVQDLEAYTGISIEWDTPLDTDAQQTINLMFASNDLPDVFLTGLTAVQAYQYAQQGSVIGLSALIEEYAPVQSGLLESTPGLRARITAPDGELYTSFGFGNAYHQDVGNMVYIHRDWLDAIGREIPTTIAQFEEILREFKRLDMNGNGDPNDEVPFGYVFYTKNANWSDLNFFGSFGLQMDQSTDFLALDDGQMVYEPATENFRNTIEWLHTLYADGLIDQEAYVQDRNQLKAKISAEPASYGSYVSWFASNAGGTNGVNYDIVGPLEGPDGHQYTNWHPRFLLGSGSAITSAADSPEIAIRWIDTVMTPEWNYQLGYGKEGEFTTVDENGQWSILPPPEGQTAEQVRFLNSLHVLPFTFPVTLNQALPPHFAEKNEAKETLFEPHLPLERAVPFYILGEDEQAEMDAIMPDILTYTQQKWAEWVMNGNIDVEWDDYVERLESMGLSTALAINQAAYDALGN